MKKIRPVVTETPEALGKALGLSSEEIQVMKLKHKLIAKLAEILNEKKLTHKIAAQKIGTSRARITNTLSGKEGSITIDFLVKALASLGYESSLRVHKRKSA